VYYNTSFPMYTVTSDFWTNGPTYWSWDSYYGLAPSVFYNPVITTLDGTATGTSEVKFSRFTSFDENDGAGWNIGDTIDVWAHDSKNEVTKDNDGFELLSAANLAASGVFLLASILM